MPDTAMQRITREAADEAKAQQRTREIANAVQLALQMMPPTQIVQLPGGIRIQHVDRPDGDYTGSIALQLRAPGGHTAYVIELPGDAIDQLHDLLHSDPPAEDDAPTEPEPETE